MRQIKIQKKDIWTFIIILVGCFLAEIFICNANSFRMVSKNEYQNKSYSIKDINVLNGVVDTDGSTIIMTGESGTPFFIEINDISTEIATINFNADFPENITNYSVCYTDEANGDYYRSFQREIVKGVEKTNWINCHFDGKSDKIIFRFDELEQGSIINFSNISINEKMPFDFSVKRFVMVSMTVLLFWQLGCTGFFSQTVKNKWHNIVLCLVGIVFVFIALQLYSHSYAGQKRFEMYNVNFIDALLQHKLELDIDVSDGLKAMENPYDTSLRAANGVEYSWDTAYYDGKYYCYFGVVPALLFFAPFKLITGEYLQFSTAVLCSYFIYIAFLNFFVIKLMRYKYPNVSFGIEFLSLIFIDSVSNIFYFVCEPSFYIAFYSTGLMFTAIGFTCYELWYINRKNKKSNIILLILGALNLSLAVGCRPPLLFYNFLLIPFAVTYIKECFENSKERENNFIKKIPFKEIIAVLIPYIIIGGALAWYNYARFGSLAEFGVTYQLTAQDQVHSKHTLIEVPLMLWLNVFQPLNFSAVFPFVFPPSTANNFAGQFYIGGEIIPLMGQAPLLIILFIPTIWKRYIKQDKSGLCYLLYSFVLMFFLLTLELLNSGIEWRYTAETAPVFCIVAFCMLANFYTGISDENKTVFMRMIFVLVWFSFAVAFLRGISGVFGYMKLYHPEYYYGIERLFSFWK